MNLALLSIKVCQECLRVRNLFKIQAKQAPWGRTRWQVMPLRGLASWGTQSIKCRAAVHASEEAGE